VIFLFFIKAFYRFTSTKHSEVCGLSPLLTFYRPILFLLGPGLLSWFAALPGKNKKTSQGKAWGFVLAGFHF